MGTNFYWKKFGTKSRMDGGHVGKRSAAGWYCWDCGVTLCKDGRVHFDRGRGGWYDACPRCGKYPISDEHNAAYVELGFSNPRKAKPTGVRTCSSFTWGESPIKVISKIIKNPFVKVVSEYDEIMTGRQFLRMIENNCPIQYTDMVGHEFS